MSKTSKLVLAALFVAVGIVLPFMTMHIPQIASQLLPMHYPVLVAGFVLGGPIALLVGLITPILRSILFGMPPMMTAIPMAFELATYGFLVGLLYHKTKKIYPSLILAMLGGRVVWGLASALLYGVIGQAFTLNIFIAGAFLNAFIGVGIQLVFIPLLVKALQKAHFIQ